MLGGVASSARTPETMAALGMLQAEPRCWLFRGSSTDRSAFRGVGATSAAAVPFPGGTHEPHLLLGRLYTVVVLHDRPEARRALAALLGRDAATVLAAELGPAGIHPVRAVAVAGDETGRECAARVREALDSGTFRVRAIDLLPEPVADAFRIAVAGYLDPEPPGLPDVLWGPDDAWLAVRGGR